MKIVQINCSATGSTGNIAKAIHLRLLDQGHDSYIFYEVGKATEQNMYRIGNYFELHMHSVLSRNLGRQGYFSQLSTYRLIGKLKKISPDVIHLHNLHGSYLNLPVLFRYLKSSTVKILITLHDCWLFTGKCPHFTVANCQKWKEHCGNCPQLSVYPRSKIDITEKLLADKKKWLSGFSDRLRIVAVSNWLRDTARQSFLAQYSIETIYNGIDTGVFRSVDGSQIRKKYKLEKKFVILGVSSNWNNQKGLNEFLQLAEDLSDDEVIVLVGLTEKQIKLMPDNIIGITRTENQLELAQLYSTADVFVNTSKEETFGLVTAEAMSCGTPVVVFDSTACAEIVDEKSGVILEPNGTKSIKEAVTELRKQNWCLENTSFDSNNMVEEYINVYKYQTQ